MNQTKFDFIAKKEEEYKSITYGFNSSIDSCRFLSSSLDSLAKAIFDNSHKSPKKFDKRMVIRMKA